MGVFKTCCCCLSLRTGCIIIGVVELLGYLSIIASHSTSASKILGTIIGVVASVLLVYGAYKKNRFCLWPWIVINIISIIVLVVGLLMCAFASTIIVDIYNEAVAQGQIQPTQDDEDTFKAAGMAFVVIIAVIILILIVILVLITLVAYSYVCELREEQERQNNDGNAPPKAYNLVPV